MIIKVWYNDNRKLGPVRNDIPDEIFENVYRSPYVDHCTSDREQGLFYILYSKSNDSTYKIPFSRIAKIEEIDSKDKL